MPVAVAAELTPEQPTRFGRLLGENLVLFRDKRGSVGLIGDRCSHRGASLCYGRVEERGISCAYHGWLYDTEGNILETPPERNDAITRSVKQKAYPIRKFLGMYWAYLGPLPTPEIPNTTSGCGRMASARSSSTRGWTATGCRPWRIRLIRLTCRSFIRS